MSQPATLKIASAQYPIGQPKTLAEWEEKVALWVRKGAATGAELLVFPEYGAIEQAACFGPEVYSDLQRTLKKVAELAASRVEFHSDLAKKHNVHIVAGSGPVMKSDGRFVNAAQLVTPDGAVGEQEKLVMTPFEREWGISAGGPVRVFQTTLGIFAIALCYDSEFPLPVRAMAEAGADVVLVPSCTERLSGYHRVRTGAMARALENTIATVQSPIGRRCPLVTRRGFQRRRGGHLRTFGTGRVGYRRPGGRDAQRRGVGHGDDRPCPAKARSRYGRNAQLRRLAASAGRPGDKSSGRNRQTCRIAPLISPALLQCPRSSDAGF